MMTYTRPLLLCCLLLAACATPPPAAQHSTTLPTSTTAPVPTSAPATPTSAPTAQPTPVEAAQRAYFVDPTGAIHAWSASTGTSAQIAQIPATADAVLAPDGSAIAFSDNRAFFLRDLGSGFETNITPDAAKAESLALSPFRWSPDSRSVLFDLDVGNDDSLQPTIFRADVGHGVARPLVAGIGPAWSPDGHSFAYAGAPFESASAYGGGPGGHLALAHAEGSGTHAHAIGDSALVYPEYQPILWSRDGTRLAAADVLVDATNGSVIARVPHADGEVLNTIVHLAPDGRSFGAWRVVRHTAAGQDDPGTFNETDEFLWVGEDGQATMVARGEEGMCSCMPLASILWVSWQADGNQALVAGALKFDGPSGLWLYTASTQTTRLIPAQSQFMAMPIPAVWSPDGHFALLANGQAVWAIELASAKLTHIGNGQWLGWAP